MAITDENTCLVLGAGVSAPFGLALGSDFLDLIGKRISADLQELIKGENFPGSIKEKIIDAACNSYAFNKMPIIGTVMSSHVGENRTITDVDSVNKDLEMLKKLVSLLHNQTSETIDDFIVENPTYANIVKKAIAVDFFSKSYKFSKDREFRLVDFASRYFEFRERNWIHLLINIVRQGIRSGRVSEDKKINIITFNYDKILEHVLDKQFSNTESNYPNYKDFFRITHVHGECGELRDAEHEPAETCCEWAGGIHVIQEKNVPQKISSAREQARCIIADSKEVYFCGFSFAGPNCRMLGLYENPSFQNRVFVVNNYNGNVGISKSIKKLERIPKSGELTARTKIEEESGSAAQPLGVSDWIRLGSLGELPG